MAKHKGKKKGHRKSAKRSRAAKKAYKKSGLYKYNLRRKKGKKGKKKGKKKSHRGKKKRRHGGGGAHGVTYYRAYQALINKGRSPHAAHKVALRIDRMAKKRLQKAIAGQVSSERAAAAAAREASHRGGWSEMWGRIGRARAAGL